jgi:uncharacterized protein (DUF1800 family)
VQELARILTGVGVNRTPDNPNVRPALRDQFVRDGLFVFNPNRHDYGDKTFLGRRIAGSGLKEVDQALDILARAPATARYVSRKLADIALFGMHVEMIEPEPGQLLLELVGRVEVAQQ